MGRKGFSSAHLMKEAVVGTQGRKLEAGTEADDLEEHCLLVSSDLFSYLLKTVQTHLPRAGIPHCGLGPHTSIHYLENVPSVRPTS